MIRQTLVIAALLATAPATAREPLPSVLEPAFARSLAVGYAALMRCGALANRGSPIAPRHWSSVSDYELEGVYPELDLLMAGVVADAVRDPAGRVSYVLARSGTDGETRYAVFREGKGCALAPVGTSEAYLPRIFPAMTIVEHNTRIVSPPPSPGFKPRKLEPMRRAFASGYGVGTRTTAALVIHHGRIIDEGYASGFGIDTPQRTWSVAKSIAATLAGAAVQRGEANVDAPAGLGQSEADPLRAITIDNLLRMASGRTSDTAGNRTDALYFGGSTVEETALHWPLVAKPGTVFRYANNDTLAAVEAIEDTFAQHPPAEFFARLGMHHTVAETDWRGSYILSSQVWSTARDLAKLGELYLQDGVWDGTRILPEGWLEYVSRPSGPQPEGEFGYGAGFWLMNKSPGIPPDTIAAMGNRGQFIIIAPKMNVVIVRRGEDPAGTRFDIAAFTREVLESLEK